MNTHTTFRKPRQAWIVQALTGLLVVYCYYQGLLKLALLGSYRFWLQHAPLVKPLAGLLAYVTPVLKLTLAALLFFPKTRNTVLHCIIAIQLLFIAWIAYVFYATPFLFWPWQKSFGVYNWFYKFLECLLVAWIAWVCTNRKY